MQRPGSVLALRSILRPIGGARVQPEKRLQLTILALLAVALAAPGLCSSARASAWVLDPAATRIAFSVKNLSMAYVDGTFRLASGRVVLDDGDLSRSTIEAVIDAGSVDTDEPKRDAHLRSADFLDVSRYPTIVFRSTRVEQADGDHWQVTGDLTLRGTTRPVVLDVQRSTAEGSRAIAHASTTIDRRDFGMTYANFAVGKQVVITIDAVGMKPPADAAPG
jgi:polyisoprenoid-binding protein YceI